MAGYKLKHGTAAKMLAASPLGYSPLHDTEPTKQYDSEVFYSNDASGAGDQAAGLEYQSKLRKRAEANPQGYMTFGGKLYDKKYYNTNEKGHLQLNPGYTMRYGKGIEFDAPKTKDADRSKSTPPASSKKPVEPVYGGASGDKGGSIGDLPTTGNLQKQDWGDVKNTTIGHGEKSKANKVSDIVGVGSNLKGEYTNVNTGKDKKSSSSKSNKGGKGGVPDQNKNARIVKSDASSSSSSKKPNPYTKAKAKDANLDQHIKDRNAAKKGSADYAFAQNQINKAYGVEKRHKADMIKMEPRKAQMIENKMQRTVTSAMDPNKDLMDKPGGRYGRVKRRQERRTARVTERNMEKRGETVSQERKNLMTDMPVVKDATGGRYKNDKSTKKMIKESNKATKQDNAYKRAAEAVEAGDKKALKKSGVGGKLKRAGKFDIRQQNKANKQEKTDLLADMPVDKDATGGRAGTFDYSQSKKQNRQRYK